MGVFFILYYYYYYYYYCTTATATATATATITTMRKQICRAIYVQQVCMYSFTSQKRNLYDTANTMGEVLFGPCRLYGCIKRREKNSGLNKSYCGTLVSYLGPVANEYLPFSIDLGTCCVMVTTHSGRTWFSSPADNRITVVSIDPGIYQGGLWFPV